VGVVLLAGIVVSFSTAPGVFEVRGLLKGSGGQVDGTLDFGAPFVLGHIVVKGVFEVVAFSIGEDVNVGELFDVHHAGRHVRDRHGVLGDRKLVRGSLAVVKTHLHVVLAPVFRDLEKLFLLIFESSHGHRV